MQGETKNDTELTSLCTVSCVCVRKPHFTLKRLYVQCLKISLCVSLASPLRCKRKSETFLSHLVRFQPKPHFFLGHAKPNPTGEIGYFGTLEAHITATPLTNDDTFIRLRFQLSLQFNVRSLLLKTFVK